MPDLIRQSWRLTLAIAQHPLPEGMLGFQQSFDVAVVASYDDVNFWKIGQVAPEVDLAQAGDGQYVLKLPKVIIGNPAGGRGLAVHALAALYLDDSASVGCQTVDAGAHPLMFHALQAGGRDVFAEPALVAFTRLRLKLVAAYYRGVEAVCFAGAFLFQQVVGALPRVFAHDSRGVGRAYALAAPLQPFGGVLSQVNDCVIDARHVVIVYHSSQSVGYSVIQPPVSPSHGGNRKRVGDTPITPAEGAPSAHPR